MKEMKTIRTTLGLLVLLVTATTCSDDQSLGLSIPPASTALSLRSIDITGGGQSQGIAPTTTRATPSEPLDKGVEIGFFIQGDANYTALDNSPGSYDPSGAVWKPTTPIWLNKNPVHLAIYAPYTSADGIAGSASLKLQSGKYTQEADLSCATSRTTSTVASITLKHLYTRLVFTLVQAEAKPADLNATVDKVVLRGTDLSASATYQFFAADLTNAYTNRTAGDLTLHCSPGLPLGTDAAAINAARVDFLVIPVNGALTADAELLVTSGKREMKVSIPKTLFTGDTALDSGKQYNLTVRLSPAGLEISKVRTTPWENVPVTGDNDANMDY